MSTRNFINATPSTKSEMIVDGIMNANAQLAKMATELQVLNGWIKTMPELIESNDAIVIEDSRLQRLAYQNEQKADNLTVQIGVFSETIDNLIKYQLNKPVVKS